MENEPLEQLPATKPGNRVLRRLRKPRNKLNAACQSIARYFKGISGRR
ncbi:hypothetical protein ACFLYS_02375 [Chloroflexota bacterium]